VLLSSGRAPAYGLLTGPAPRLAAGLVRGSMDNMRAMACRLCTYAHQSWHAADSGANRSPLQAGRVEAAQQDVRTTACAGGGSTMSRQPVDGIWRLWQRDADHLGGSMGELATGVCAATVEGAAFKVAPFPSSPLSAKRSHCR
jgi:hypothetical protein